MVALAAPCLTVSVCFTGAKTPLPDLGQASVRRTPPHWPLVSAKPKPMAPGLAVPSTFSSTPHLAGTTWAASVELARTR